MIPTNIPREYHHIREHSIHQPIHNRSCSRDVAYISYERYIGSFSIDRTPSTPRVRSGTKKKKIIIKERSGQKIEIKIRGESAVALGEVQHNDGVVGDAFICLWLSITSRFIIWLHRESLTAALGLGCTLELWPDASSLTMDCFCDDESTPEQRYWSDAFTSRAYHGHAAGLFSLYSLLLFPSNVYIRGGTAITRLCK